MIASEEQKGKGNGLLLEEGSPYATETHTPAGARTRARDSVTDSGDTRVTEDSDEDDFAAVDEVVDLWIAQAKDTIRKLGAWPGRNSGFKAEHPASTYDLLAYAKDAPMSGDVPALRILQQLHCFLVAIPTSWFLYTVAWLLQRPARSLCFLIFAVIVWRLH